MSNESTLFKPIPCLFDLGIDKGIADSRAPPQLIVLSRSMLCVAAIHAHTASSGPAFYHAILCYIINDMVGRLTKLLEVK